MNKKINWFDVVKLVITALAAALGGGGAQVLM